MWKENLNMGENGKNIAVEATKELMKPVSQAVDNLANPTTKTVGDKFATLFDLLLGSHISIAREKQVYRQSIKLQKYKEDIQEKLLGIPEQDLIEAPLHVVGPAIEAAKYYIEADVLSEMFSNLIASAFDAKKVSEVHPAFTEIIKQLSPLDARNLLILKDGENRPICDYQLKMDMTVYTTIAKNIFLENEEESDLNLQSSSIVNLIRLGLLDLKMNAKLTNSSYEKFKQHDEFLSLQKQLEELKQKGEYEASVELTIAKGFVSLTSYGADFVNTVIR